VWRVCWIVVGGMLACLVDSGALAEVEPWADGAIPVKHGLVLWLDASSQVRAFAASGLPAVAADGPLPVWFDGSGRGARFVQRSRDAWPRLVVATGKAAVRFDGKDDRLEAAGFAQKLERFTVFLVAAPRSNGGAFRGLLAANEVGRRDYDTGFTIDLGPVATPRFGAVNLEGKGFAGAVDLMNESPSFEGFHTIEARFGDGPGGVALVVDGRPQGRRDRRAGTLRADELTLGARFYSNEPVPQYVQGFFDGDVAEVLVFDRILSEPESRSVRDYLDRKHAGLSEALAAHSARAGRPLRTVADPPPVQLLVPGFAVKALPVKLSNINNLKYRRDGKLVALGYNGNVSLLSDRDGDGLEEHVETFWENRGRLRAPIGLALTPPGFRHGQGVLVASKGKCSLLVDDDNDDRADREVVVADGWKESDHGVDALGVAVAGDGSVYFGVGTASFTEPYLLDPSGRSRYDPKAEHGAVLRVAPDFRSRAVFASGIRFPVALAFNKAGDLFATDQEGATWLANGNPFDELLHVQQGRHYGFPPRHPRHLPGVIDEPSIFDYTPQHQSTCGLVFNEPVNGGKAFGPAWWAGDALVCGYSRGKIYRTKLVHTAAGYVGQTALLGVLGRLTVDACVSPDGSLVVATHSGGPDWGSGPDGPGTLYKIVYSDRDRPQPVLAWAGSPREVRVAFDRPLDPSDLTALARGASVSYGRAVTAGERFETLRPGYAVVAAQTVEPRFELAVRAVSVTPDRRTLLLATDPHPEAVTYAITLPGPGRPARVREKTGELPQEPAIDLSYTLEGVEASWRGDESNANGSAAWSGWLPHLDLDVARAFTTSSADHDRLWPLLDHHRGTLRLSARVDLKDLLRPAVQPGSRTDFTLPDESVTLTFAASGPFTVTSMGRRVTATGTEQGNFTARLDLGTNVAEPVPIELELTLNGTSNPRLNVTYFTAEDSRPRALPLVRIVVPWARTGRAPESEGPTRPEELSGGSWSRGKAVFFGEKARCSACHAVRGEGGKVGPDLSNLGHRDYASVLRDVREPSFAINPDHITYNLALLDGRVLTGTVRSEAGTLRIGDAQGRETLVNRSDVEELHPLPTSTMPEGLAEAAGPEALKDLLTFLLTPDLTPAPIRREGAPPPRTRAEVEAVLGQAPEPGAARRAPRPLKVVLVSGPKDHGVDEHDYPLWRRRWAELLGRAEGVTVTTADGWPGADDLATADVLVWYSANPSWSLEKGALLDAFLARGGGMVYLHYAVNGRSAPEELARRIGLSWRDGGSRFRHGPLDLAFKSPDHPITAGFRNLHLEDESYWELVGDPGGVNVLATSLEDGRPRPLLWTREAGRGRVFVSIPGHYTWTFDDPLFRTLILRGIAWTSHEPADRFRALMTLGARVAPDESPAAGKATARD
jgi:putative heme-binding domain-containing protein